MINRVFLAYTFPKYLLYHRSLTCQGLHLWKMELLTMSMMRTYDTSNSYIDHLPYLPQGLQECSAFLCLRGTVILEILDLSSRKQPLICNVVCPCGQTSGWADGS
jgi:hypothetical protein